MIDEMTTVLEPSPLSDFVETKYIKDITKRAILMLKQVFLSISGVHPVQVKLLLLYIWQVKSADRL